MADSGYNPALTASSSCNGRPAAGAASNSPRAFTRKASSTLGRSHGAQLRRIKTEFYKVSDGVGTAEDGMPRAPGVRVPGLAEWPPSAPPGPHRMTFGMP